MMLKYYLIACAVMSALAFLFFAIDKANAADGRTRIPEITLLTLSALGGGVGAMMGRTFLHHKSNARRKMHFAIVLWVSFVMQIAFGGYLCFMGG